MMKKEYESPKAEFFRVQESIFCSGNGTGGGIDPDWGAGWEEQDPEYNPWG